MRTSFTAPALMTLAGMLMFVALPALAQEKSQDKQPATSKETPSDVRDVTYIGLTVEPVHPSLWSHLHGVFKRKEGLLVLNVEPNSPAERAGIHNDDILVTYDGQYLYSADQLAKLVKTDKADRMVDIGVVRYGKPQDMQVTLGARKVNSNSPELYADTESRVAPQWISVQKNNKNDEAAWDEFDSLIIKNLGDHRFDAQIQYKNEKGKIERHSFTGTREEIHKQIMAEKDLPTPERNNLLRSLNLPNDALDLSGIVYGLGIPYWGSPLWTRSL